MALDAHRSAVVFWARCGARLHLLKAEHGKHAQWLPWLAENFPDISERTCRAMMKLATDYPELADLERDVDQVLPEYLASNPEMRDTVAKGINAMLSRSSSRPRLPGARANGRHQAEVIDSVPLEVREEVIDVVGAIVEMLPSGLRTLLKDGEAEALAQTYNGLHGENPPNPSVVATFYEGAAAMDRLLKDRAAAAKAAQRAAAAERQQRAPRAGRVRLSDEQVISEPTAEEEVEA